MYIVRDEDEIRLKKCFTYHPPIDNQLERYSTIREMGKTFATMLISFCPPSRELSIALTKVEEASFWANAAIARNEEEK
jgi:hypothetical protein